MMYRTLIVLAAAVCAGSAAFTVNVLEGGPMGFAAVDSCDYRACDQLCRRLGFPGGACVGDRCKCDNFLQSQAANEILVDDIAEAVPKILRDEEKPEEHESLIIDQVATDQEVFRGEEKSGSCDCDPRSCDVYCFRIHYTGGICVTGQCRCYR